MSPVYAEIQISNPALSELSAIKTDALVDSGALHLCIPKHLALQLKLSTLEEREVTLADGSRQLIPYAGPVKVNFANRTAFVGVMILGDEVLLGAIPMEDMDVIIHPTTRSLMVNPESPNVAMSKIKSVLKCF
ncbi:clan AA aspartic protease [Methyloprofundus sp.]|uniref:clan AA aspartic protease n=1 Tax=Methyloprofundus sp. TaxID=2020875 RepID=UPI003D127C89